MALVKGTGPAGLVSTEGVLAEQKVIDMDPVIKMLDLDTDQFTTMLDDLGTKATDAREGQLAGGRLRPEDGEAQRGHRRGRHHRSPCRRPTRTTSRSTTRSGT